MDFESVADELFTASREQFTALRDERARQARPDRGLAKRIASLRKPTVSAWLVNHVSRNHPDEVDRLAEVGRELRQAHQKLAGDRLRALSRQRHELVEVLSGRARRLARDTGQPLGDDAARQVEYTFEAVVSDPRAAEEVRGARLSKALTPGSAEDWLTAAAAPPSADPAPPKPAPPKPAPPEPAPPEQAPAEQTPEAPPARPAPAEPAPQRKAVRRDREREKARAEAENADRELDRARRALTKAERNADRAAERVTDLRERLAEAVTAQRSERAALTAARKTVKAAERAAQDAHARATQATRP